MHIFDNVDDDGVQNGDDDVEMVMMMRTINFSVKKKSFYGLSSNRLFASSLQPLLQGESTCEVFVMNISFHSY